MTESPPGGVAAIVLAAGESSRLGQPKQLVAPEGEPLLHRAVRLALEAGCSPVVVVLGAVDQPCRDALATLPADRLRIVNNSDWREGMSTSLHVGLAALREPWGDKPPGGEVFEGVVEPASSELVRGVVAPASVLVLVTDQVRLSAESLRRLLGAHAMGRRPVTAARYSGRLGVPAIFRYEAWPQLAALRGDKGARLLLEAHGDRATAVEMPEATQELDTPEDLARLVGDLR